MKNNDTVQNEKNCRDSNIELLRLLAGCAVIILHYNFLGDGGAVSQSVGVNYYFLLILEIICATAVNIFILITGYFNCDKEKINLMKAIQLIVQLIVFNLIIYTIEIVVDKNIHFTLKGFVGALIPTNYYVMLYVVLLFVSPYINIIIQKLSLKELQRMILIVCFLFSVWATLVEVLKKITKNPLAGLSSVGISGCDAGYTIVNFVMIYLLGAYIKKSQIAKECKWKKTILCLVMCCLLIFIWRNILPDTAWIYCNPFLIIESFCIFVLFLKIKIHSNIINLLAPASFSCYLIHMAILKKIDFSILVNKSVLFLICHLLLTVVSIYCISWLVYYLYDKITSPVYKKIRCYERKDN